MKGPENLYCYVIWIKGYISRLWLASQENITCENLPSGTTRITCNDKDDSAFYGVLTVLRDMGVSILKIVRKKRKKFLFRKEKAMKQGLFQLGLAFVVCQVLILTGCATFQGEIPLEAQIPEVIYISPQNQDGIQDAVCLPVTVPKLDGLKLAGYSITVFGDLGTPVYEQKNAAPKGKTVTAPAEIYWDGKNSNGGWVPDGVYFLAVLVWDEHENKGSAKVKVVVDNIPPQLNVFLPYLFFSPNNDSKQDNLIILQSASSAEELWTGEFTDGRGDVVKRIEWKGQARDFNWDGKNNDNKILPEGTYSYKIACTDLAGNTSMYTVTGIQIDNSVYPLTVKTDKRAFSPNGDGIQDSIGLLPTAQSATNLVTAQIEIINSQGVVVEIIKLANPLPARIDYSGKKGGVALADGQYFARFSAVYKNGSNPLVVSDGFFLDTKPPSAVLRLSFNVFSPDGDGNKDEVNIMQSSSVEKEWTGSIQTAAGQELMRYSWQQRAVSFVWNGKDKSGIMVQDGEYYYVLSSTDEAGNSFKLVYKGLLVDTRPTPLMLSVAKPAFSPNNDGIDDVVLMKPDALIKDGIVKFSLTIQNGKGETVKSYETDREIPATLSWNGEDTSGTVTEGSYSVVMEVEYEKGNIGRFVLDKPVVIDLSPPQIEVKLGNLPFSPDSDGVNDSLNIKITVNDISGVDKWAAVIKDPKGEVFVTLTAAQFKDGVYVWNGRSATGELVQSAFDYQLEVSAADKIGNKTVTTADIPVDILVLKDGDRLKISISSIYFKAFTADYLSLEPQVVANNLATLDRLAQVLKKFSAYNIRLEGHAVRVYWYDAKKWQIEEKDVLLPLSKQRAEAIRNALIQRGVAAERMTTYGMGGYYPLVPHSDAKNNWKNRRVEFILVKK